MIRHPLFSLSPKKGGQQGAQGMLPSVFTLKGIFLQSWMGGV